MSAAGMTLTVLATQLAEAISKDPTTTTAGLSLGEFGPNVSAWLRDLAANVLTTPTPSSGPCEHIFDFQATVHWIDETKRLAGSDAHNRMYGDRYFCKFCLYTKIINERPRGNSYGKPAEGTLPR